MTLPLLASATTKNIKIAYDPTELTRILHEGSGICSVVGNTVWSIVQTSIAIAMVFEGSAEM